MTHQLTIIFCLVTFLSGCGPDIDEPSCRAAVDCWNDQFCIAGVCSNSEQVSLVDAGLDQKATASADLPVLHSQKDLETQDSDPSDTKPPHPCGSQMPPNPGDLVINEILAAVPSGDAGDANWDGTRDAFDDEFVEIVNIAEGARDLAGIAIFTQDSQKFRFEPTCLQPLDSIIVFGGGDPNPPAEMAYVVSETRLGLANSGGLVELKDIDSVVIATEPYGEALGSWTRFPDLSGPLVSHVEANGVNFSPGTCTSGRQFRDGCEAELPDL